MAELAWCVLQMLNEGQSVAIPRCIPIAKMGATDRRA